LGNDKSIIDATFVAAGKAVGNVRKEFKSNDSDENDGRREQYIVCEDTTRVHPVIHNALIEKTYEKNDSTMFSTSKAISEVLYRSCTAYKPSTLSSLQAF
jgi:hypothetical protein